MFGVSLFPAEFIFENVCSRRRWGRKRRKLQKQPPSSADRALLPETFDEFRPRGQPQSKKSYVLSGPKSRGGFRLEFDQTVVRRTFCAIGAQPSSTRFVVYRVKHDDGAETTRNGGLKLADDIPMSVYVRHGRL